MRFNLKVFPRSETDYARFVKGGSGSLIKYIVRVPDGNWSPWWATFESQREQGYETSDCWCYAGLHIIATQCNFLLAKGQFPKEAVDFFKANGYLDEKGSFAFSERFIACLATYPNGSPVRDGGNDQIQLPKLVKQWGLLPRKDFDSEPGAYLDQDAFNANFFDKTKITSFMYAKAKLAMKYISIQYEWVGAAGVMPDIEELRTMQCQSPMQIGVPVPKDPMINWNVPVVKYDGGRQAQHSIGLKYVPETPEKLVALGYPCRDQYNPADKSLSNDYFIPLVSHIYIAPILTAPYVPPATATAYPDPKDIFVQIRTAIAEFFKRLYTRIYGASEV